MTFSSGQGKHQQIKLQKELPYEPRMTYLPPPGNPIFTPKKEELNSSLQNPRGKVLLPNGRKCFQKLQ